MKNVEKVIKQRQQQIRNAEMTKKYRKKKQKKMDILLVGIFVILAIIAIQICVSKIGKPVTLPAGASKTYIEYRVQSGDNLHSIAKDLIEKYDMDDIYSVDDLSGEISHLNSCFNNIYAGESLVCPVAYYEDSMIDYKG